MIPSPDWRTKVKNHDVEMWAAARPLSTFMDLWEDSHLDPLMMPYLAEAGGATYKQLVYAACGVARLCLPLFHEEETRPRTAIEVAEKWTQGHGSKKNVKLALGSAFAASSTVNAAILAVFHILTSIDSMKDPTVGTSFNTNASNTIGYTYQAGIDSHLIRATMRIRLPFELSVPPKRLTVWQWLLED